MGERSLHLLVLSVVGLLGLGIVMLLSTSVFSADPDDIYHDVNRQALWMGFGLVACVVCAAIDYRFWQRWRWAFFGLACVLLALCFVPILGEGRNGSYRWVSLRDFGIDFIRVQPSEMAKLATVFVVAGWAAKYVERRRELGFGFVFPLFIALVPVGLIAVETDMGTAILLTTVVMALLFLAGCRWWLVAGSFIASLGVLAIAVMNNENRWNRVMAFLDPEAHRHGYGQQQWRSLLALGEGGPGGLGLGQGREKLMHLSYAHTDFIFPMIGEELGLYGTLGVVLAFALILLGGFSIAKAAPDRFGTLLGAGIVLLLTIQAALNIAVTTSAVPNKGLPLPFVSYGGSNLLFSLAGIGILINIYRQGHSPATEPREKLFDRPRRTLRV